VPTHITPSIRRMLDRMAGTPVAVYDASWNLLVANPAYAALMGDSSGWRGNERNGVWRYFLGVNTRVRHSPEAEEPFASAMVADLRAAAGRYPADQALRRVVAELRANSARFAELWDTGAVGTHESSHKTIDHPHVGAVTLDCDILTVAGSDLRVMIYTAEPGTEDAERLELITVIGTQTLVG
jgi:transcription regulator MmyB-like protein